MTRGRVYTPKKEIQSMERWQLPQGWDSPGKTSLDDSFLEAMWFQIHMELTSINQQSDSTFCGISN